MNMQGPNANKPSDEYGSFRSRCGPEQLSGMSSRLAADYVTYVVSPGETLSRIAQRFGTTASALADFNHISPSEQFYAGDTIRIPEKCGT